MAKKLVDSLNPILGQAQKKKQLTWLHVYAPWCEGSTAWREELAENPAWLRLREQMQTLEWNRDWSPEIDQGLQSFLQARTGQQAWPVNLFLSPEGRAVFVCGALKVTDFVEVTRQLWVAWQGDAEALCAQAEKEFQAFRAQDPLALRNSKILDAADDADILGRTGLYRFLTPLEKSLQMDTGLIGVGQVFQYPMAYRALLGFEDLGKWGEVSLVRLARSPLNDVVGGGFFRAALASDSVQDPEARAAWAHLSAVSTEKLLIENAELLETYIEAQQTRKAPYLSQAAFELLDAILEDFRIQTPVGADSVPSTFASAISASKKFYDLGPEDLLKALPPKERQAAQLFFGIEGGGARLPRIPTEVSLLSDFVGIEPVDLRLQLIDSRKRLKEFRKTRGEPPRKCPPERLSELTLLRVLAYAAFAFDTPQVAETCIEMLERYREEWSVGGKDWTAREKGAYLRALASMARLHSAQRGHDEAKKCFEEAEELIFGLQDPLFHEAVVELPFLGPRVDVCDHSGVSGLASLLAGLLDYNALSRMGLRGKHNLPVDIGHTLSEALRYARPLGLHAAGIYWVLMRYQKLQQPEAHA
jgi:uncharacterized protein YyaL (SSP411 family)